MKKTCCYCPAPFTADPRRFRSLGPGKGRRSRQTACSQPTCQRQRRKDTQRRWRMKNPTYDDGREIYLRQWRKEHPGFSTSYRKSHPDYEEWNRQQQRRRDRKKRDLGKQDLIDQVHAEKLTRIQHLIDLGKQDVIALQEKIRQNRAHEKPTYT